MIPMKTRQRICHILAAILSICVIAPNAFLLFDRGVPFTLSDGYTVPSVLERGKPYQFSWLIAPRRWRECDATVYWQIQDSQGVVWAQPPAPSLFVSLPSGRVRVVGRERVLPSGIASGPVTLKSSMEFHCNWTQRLWPVRAEFPPVKSVVR